MSLIKLLWTFLPWFPHLSLDYINIYNLIALGIVQRNLQHKASSCFCAQKRQLLLALAQHEGNASRHLKVTVYTKVGWVPCTRTLRLQSATETICDCKAGAMSNDHLRFLLISHTLFYSLIFPNSQDSAQVSKSFLDLSVFSPYTLSVPVRTQNHRMSFDFENRWDVFFCKRLVK